MEAMYLTLLMVQGKQLQHLQVHFITYWWLDSNVALNTVCIHVLLMKMGKTNETSIIHIWIDNEEALRRLVTEAANDVHLRLLPMMCA